MIGLYKLIGRLGFGLVYPYGAYRAAQGDRMWRGRLGLVDLPECDVWLHAASVGESRVIGYLAEWLLEHDPKIRIHITIMTATGLAATESLFAEHARVTFSHFPLDVRWPAARMLRRLQPKVLVLAETEIWPVFLEEAGSRGAKIILVNGRMSAKAFGRYKHVRGAMQRLLRLYDRFFFKTEEDRERYEAIGLPEGRYETAGDMKFDAPLMALPTAVRAELRHEIGVTDDQFLLVCGSTRPGEEELLLSAFNRLLADVDTPVRLVIAPRHIERADEVGAMIQQAGLSFDRYGEGQSARPIILVDRMGLLTQLYQLADLAFVGGTLADIGGHNILEPVWAGTPVIYGPSLDNVREAAEYIEAHNYGARLDTAAEMADLVRAVITKKRTFARKSSADVDISATGRAGEYILRRLRDV